MTSTTTTTQASTGKTNTQSTTSTPANTSSSDTKLSFTGAEAVQMGLAVVGLIKIVASGYQERETMRQHMAAQAIAHADAMEKSEKIIHYRALCKDDLTVKEKEMLTDAFCRNLLGR